MVIAETNKERGKKMGFGMISQTIEIAEIW